jgi:adenylate cyclase
MRARRPSPLALLTLAALLIAGAWGALLASRHLEGRASALDRIEAALVDLRFQVTGPRPAPAGIAIVAIDDEAVREAGAFPLPRDRLARLVEAIAAAGPRAVALDLLLIDPGPPEADAALRRALERSRAVIAAAGLFARR